MQNLSKGRMGRFNKYVANNLDSISISNSKFNKKIELCLLKPEFQK